MPALLAHARTRKARLARCPFQKEKERTGTPSARPIIQARVTAGPMPTRPHVASAVPFASSATMASSCPTAKLISLAVRGASDAALILTSAGDVVARNAPADKLFGFHHEQDDGAGPELKQEPSSRNVSSLLAFSHGARSWTDVAACLGHAEYSCSVIIIQHDGNKLTGSARITKLDGSDYYAVYVCALDTSRSKLWSDSEELRRLKRIQDTVDASFDACFTIDEKGNILMLNDAAVKLFGYDYNEVSRVR